MISLTQRNNCSFSTNLDMFSHNSGHKGLKRCHWNVFIMNKLNERNKKHKFDDMRITVK